MKVARGLLMCVLLFGTTSALEEPATPSAVEEVKRAIAAYEAERGRLANDTVSNEQAQRMAQDFFAQVQKLRASEANKEKVFHSALVQAVMPQAKSSNGLHEGLADALIEAIGKDKADEVLKEKYAPSGNDYTPAPGNAFITGKGGTLWVFWSQDSPQNEFLAGKINRLRRDLPTIAVFDIHMMPLMMWYQSIKELASVKAQLEQLDPTRTPESQFDEKLVLRNATVKKWEGFNSMSKYNRDGGYLLMEDTTAARAYEVIHLPCFRFISPGGAMHKLDGVSEKLELGSWITQCLEWERLHLEEEKLRVLHK